MIQCVCVRVFFHQQNKTLHNTHLKRLIWLRSDFCYYNSDVTVSRKRVEWLFWFLFLFQGTINIPIYPFIFFFSFFCTFLFVHIKLVDRSLFRTRGEIIQWKNSLICQMIIVFNFYIWSIYSHTRSNVNNKQLIGIHTHSHIGVLVYGYGTHIPIGRQMGNALA